MKATKMTKDTHTMPDGTVMSGKKHSKDSKPVKEPKEKKPKVARVSRKDNKSYEKKTIKTKTGKTTSVYVKILADNKPTDMNKPITNPAVAVEQGKAELKATVADGLSQKELDKLERIRARKQRKQKA